jgi:hypothetical protein
MSELINWTQKFNNSFPIVVLDIPNNLSIEIFERSVLPATFDAFDKASKVIRLLS